MLGEIGENICDKPGSSGYDQFAALNQHFANVSESVQGLLLTTYMKMFNLYPEVMHRYLYRHIFMCHCIS